MKNSQQLFQDFLKTHAVIASMTLGGQGWKTNSVDADQLLEPQVYVYAVDCLTGWSWMASIPLKSFTDISSWFKSKRAEWPVLHGALGTVIKNRATATAGTDSASAVGVQPGAPEQWEQELAMLIAGYSATTQVAKQEGAISTGSHFIVHRYEAKRGGTRLRPFVHRPVAGGVMDSQFFSGLSSHVIGLDQAAHPEWF